MRMRFAFAAILLAASLAANAQSACDRVIAQIGQPLSPIIDDLADIADAVPPK